MSFLHPPSGFPPHLAVIWSLIWGQLLLLRAAVRAVYGKGVQYHWSVSPYGRVFLTSVDWIPSQKADRAWLKPRLHASDRVAAALRWTSPDPGLAAMPCAPRPRPRRRRRMGAVHPDACPLQPAGRRTPAPAGNLTGPFSLKFRRLP